MRSESDSAAVPPAPSRAAIAVPWALATLCVIATAWFAARYVVAQSENRLLAQREALLVLNLKATQAQTEAEQIIGRRAAEEFQKTTPFPGDTDLTLLIPGAGPSAATGAVWCPKAAPEGLLAVQSLARNGTDDHYELWTTGVKPERLATFSLPGGSPTRIRFKAAASRAPESGFVVRRVPNGNAGSQEAAEVVLRPP